MGRQRPEMGRSALRSLENSASLLMPTPNPAPTSSLQFATIPPTRQVEAAHVK